MTQKIDINNISDLAHPMTMDFVNLLQTHFEGVDAINEKIFLMEGPTALHPGDEMGAIPVIAAQYKFESMTAAISSIWKLVMEDELQVMIYSVQPYNFGVIVRMAVPGAEFEVKPVRKEEEAKKTDEKMLDIIRSAFPNHKFSVRDRVLTMDGKTLKTKWMADMLPEAYS